VALSSLIPVAATLYHHAIEMYLKGGLALTTTEKQRRNLGHKLSDIWPEFKALFPNDDLSAFDAVISGLDPFEDVRYPERILEHGLASAIDWGPQPSTYPTSIQHVFNLPELDRLVSRFYDLTLINRLAVRPPGLNSQPLASIIHDKNPEVTKWYPFGVPKQ
jgi:hypothetical protein